MPSIELKITKKMTREEKKRLADRLSEDIVLIEGKSQPQVMTIITDDVYIQQGAECLENAAFVNMNCFGHSNPKDNEKYTVRLFEILNEELGTEKQNIYMNLTEREWWGVGGQVFTC